jgi:hypothetical protein
VALAGLLGPLPESQAVKVATAITNKMIELIDFIISFRK